MGVVLGVPSVADELAAEEAAVPVHVAGDIVYGNESAPIEIIEYASFTCPHCAHFAKEVLPFLKAGPIAEGKVKLVFRNFVLNRLDLAVAVTTRCTTNPEITKRLAEIYFSRQQEWTSASNPLIAVTSIAHSHGLEIATVNKCLESKPIMQGIIEDLQEGRQKYDIKGVPTVIMNGEKVEFADYSDLKAQITKAANSE